MLRALTGDDAVQTPVARAVLASDFSLSATVLLECAWVLRSFYRWDRATIVTGLSLLLDMPSLQAAPRGALWAIGRYAAGADFADMLHLAEHGHGEAFVTFDAGIAPDAGTEPPVPIETLA